MKLSLRMTNLLASLSIIFLVFTAFYLQEYKGIFPCPLCLLQRGVFFLLAGFFLLGTLQRKGNWFTLFLMLSAALCSSLGLLLAGRQVWLQHIPSALKGDCAASLQYLLQVLPITSAIEKIWQGGTECALVTWKLFSLSLAEWSLICFVFYLILSFCQIFKICLKDKLRR
jgi:disulfide bond formation protein DsbB